MSFAIPADFIAEREPQAGSRVSPRTTPRLAAQLERRGIDIETMTRRAMGYAVAVPTWGVGTGGTRFARFPGPGEPRDIFDKLEDCGVIHQLTQRDAHGVAAYSVGQGDRLYRAAAGCGLARPRVRCGQLQHLPGSAGPAALLQVRLAHPCGQGGASPGDRAQSSNASTSAASSARRALTIWIADGSNFPGQSNLNAAFDRYMDSLREIYAALPEDWLVFIEHKLLRAGLLFDRDLRLGFELHGRYRTWTEGEMPGRSRPSCARHQYRADRRPPHPRGQARRIPFQRLEIWRRRPRFRLHRSLPPVPGVQRAGGCRMAQGAGFRARLHDRPVAQRDRSRSKASCSLGDRSRTCLCLRPR